VFTPDDPRYGDALFGLIACADTRIRAAVYEATWDCFAEALQARLDADSDLVVELVVDDDRCPSVGDSRGCALGPLAAHPRVTFVDDMRSRLMHHKFITVDDRWAWVSSGNMTTRSFCTDFNNAIVVEEPAIVAGYDAHFERMFELGAFGPAAPAEPSRSGKYALYFSPETPIDDPSLWFVEMIEAIESATSQVTFVISAWTRVEVSTALVDAHNRGLSVRGVVSGAYVDEAPAQALLAAGVPLRVDNVHSKVLVVDDRLVVTGSPNWSLASWQNNENSLFIDDPAIAAAYGAEIDRIFASAAAP
jgi:phosphatidylserine/phosphatidylglycerophosphate/cardiolipin synthase-like enzyme